MKKRLLSICLAVVALITAVAVDMNVKAASEYGRVIDEADILTEEEEKNLTMILNEISNRQQMDVIVVTVGDYNDVCVRPDGEYSGSMMEAADDIFDYCGYGLGEKKSGILLLLSMNERDYWMSTAGYTQTAIKDVNGQIFPAFKEDLSNNNYYEAFVNYAHRCDKYMTAYYTGEKVRDDFGAPRRIVISLVAGLILAFIVVGKLKGEMKSVRFAPDANNYFDEGSLNINLSRDTYLFSAVTKTAKPQSSSSSGSHTSSSGSSHGGGGGKF